MDLLNSLLNPKPKRARKAAGTAVGKAPVKKARRTRAARKPGASRRHPNSEMTAAEVLREALLRG